MSLIHCGMSSFVSPPPPPSLCLCHKLQLTWTLDDKFQRSPPPLTRTESVRSNVRSGVCSEGYVDFSIWSVYCGHWVEISTEDSFPFTTCLLASFKVNKENKEIISPHRAFGRIRDIFLLADKCARIAKIFLFHEMNRKLRETIKTDHFDDNTQHHEVFVF